MKAKWLLLAAGLAAAAIAGALLWQQKRAAPKPAFAPNRANDKVLVAGGWSGNELSKILSDFTRAYSAQLRKDFTWEVRADGPLQKANFPNDIQPWLFLYLVNYAQYPKGFDIGGRTILVAATATLTPDFELPAQKLYGKRATFYVPANDDKFDMVYAHADGTTYEIGFDADAWKEVKDPRIPGELGSLLGK